MGKIKLSIRVSNDAVEHATLVAINDPSGKWSDVKGGSKLRELVSEFTDELEERIQEGEEV